MKLPYGLLDGIFVHISEVHSGRTDVHCPYCNKNLIAKKGKIKRHHFAHDGTSCIQSFNNNLFGIQGRLPLQLPLCVYATQKTSTIHTNLAALQSTFDSLQKQQADQTTLIPDLLFHLKRLVNYYKDRHLEQKAIQIKTLLQEVQTFIRQKIAPFPSFHLIRGEPFTAAYTNGQKRCSATQVQEDIYEFYYPISFDKYVQCLKTYHQTDFNFPEITTRINLFQKEVRYFKQFNLYFLEIQTATQVLYKIGLTSRPISSRLKEIEQDLKVHFPISAIKVLFLQKEVAFLETFFKQKYTTYQLPLGQLTEYFSFPTKVLYLLLKDFECITITQAPNRNSSLWIYWAYFHSNKKLYGYHDNSKSIYVDGKKIRLTKEEEKKIRKVVSDDLVKR